MAKPKEWHTTKIPNPLYSEVEKYVKSDKGKKEGFTSSAGFITHSTREELRRRKG